MSPPSPHSPTTARYWPLAPLRRYLVAVILLATLPLAALMVTQIFLEVRAGQAEIEGNLARSAAALSQAVESEVNSSLDALTALAHSGAVRERGAAQLQSLLQGRPRPRRDWDSIFLLDAAGQVLFDSAGPQAGTGSPQLRELHRRVAERGQPAVSGPAQAAAGSTHAVLLAVPVGEADGSPMVLGARIDNDVWGRLAGAASRPEGGYALLFDAGQRIISSTLQQPGEGTRLSADAAQRLPEQAFGVARTAGVDGRTVYAAWQTVPAAGWGVQVAVPASPIDAAHRRAILAALGASGASLLLGVVLAFMAAQRITGPLRRLATQGHAGLPGRVAVKEIAMLRDALRQAARQDEAVHGRLRENQRLMELAQEAGHVGFFHYRMEPDALVWTPGHCKLFGLDAQPAGGIGRWFDSIAAGDRERIEREFWTACALRRENATLEYCVVRPDGSARWLSSRLLLQCAADGAVTQVTGVTVDMTDQREAEMQRVRLTERAVAERQQAEAASRAKDEFLTMLSHELRNPLGAISAAIDVLDAAPPASESAAEARAIIARQTRNLAHMMNDLLDVGRAIAGKILLARAPVNLAALAGRVHRTQQLTREGAAHDVRLEAQEAWVHGDAVRLEQVMTNLLTNALKYTPEGGRIKVRVARQGAHAVFEVQDAGMGIPASLLPHVFDLFVQGERTLDRRAGGLGIGLTLVRRLVELHGGEVGAHSSEQGSRFTVRLPATEPPPPIDAQALPASRRRRVLVIDDNADVLAALRSKLELDGHAVSTAADGVEGLSRLLRQQPEVSIVDIGLPGITGYELARHARAAGYAGRMIALSGYGAERDIHDALTAGFDAYLVKPVDRTQLRSSLCDD